MHGAGTEAAKQKAARYVQEYELRRTLEITGHDIEPVTDPYTELAQIAGEIRIAREQLRDMVSNLQSIKDIGSDKYATQVDVIMQAYTEFLKLSAKVATDMSRLDLTERIARLHAAIDDATATIVRDALAGALGTVDLTPPQRDEILREFGVRLRVREAAKLPTVV